MLTLFIQIGKEFYECKKHKNFIGFQPFSGKSAENFSRCLIYAAFMSNAAEFWLYG
jgi:hypothetical protein